jgi:hypothetical protein
LKAAKASKVKIIEIKDCILDDYIFIKVDNLFQEDIDKEVQVLKALKDKYKAVTGAEWKAPEGSNQPRAPAVKIHITKTMNKLNKFFNIILLLACKEGDQRSSKREGGKEGERAKEGERIKEGRCSKQR